MGDRYINNSNGNGNAKRNYIWYIDANNLYGYTMMQKLPYKDFKHITLLWQSMTRGP